MNNEWNFKNTWKTMQDIPDENIQAEFIKTGINRLDGSSGGLMLGGTAIWSGTNGSAKSTLISQIGLNIVESEQCKVAFFSGELVDTRFKQWMYMQAAGKEYNVRDINKYGEYGHRYRTPVETMKKISNWLGDRLYLYNNNVGMKIEEVGNSIVRLILTDPEVKVIFIDNLFVIDLMKLSDNKWEAQRQFVLTLCTIAKKHNVHISFVAHPTKVKTLIRKEDISGSSDLANAVDAIYVCHRVTNDFKARTREFFGWSKEHELYEFDNIIEIAKDRETGVVDFFLGLYYEPQSKRLKNEKHENVIYSWQNGQKKMELPEEIQEYDEDYSEDLPY